ncbi:MAG: hypothetical protein AB1696_09350 [Planctomycetota bacterium]
MKCNEGKGQFSAGTSLSTSASKLSKTTRSPLRIWGAFISARGSISLMNFRATIFLRPYLETKCPASACVFCAVSRAERASSIPGANAAS